MPSPRSESDRLKLLSRVVASNRADMIKTLILAREEVEARILKAARTKNFGTARKIREGLLRDLIGLYNKLQGDLDTWTKGAIENTSKPFWALAAEDLLLTEAERSVISFTIFSEEHFTEYFERIHPFNADRLAAVNVHINPGINRMLESDVREIQNAVVAVFRQAELSAMTPEERFKTLRREMEDIGDKPQSWAFIDASGKRWKNGNYFQMLNRTVSAKVARDSYNDTLIEEGRDLVQVIGGTSPNSHPACVRWNGKLLSLTGATPGFTTVAEAEEQGLHHPNCVHTEVYISDKTTDGRELIADPDARKPRDVELPKAKAKVGVGKDEKVIREQAAKAEKEQAAKEQAERQRKAREEAERAAKARAAKEAAERTAREAAERAAAESGKIPRWVEDVNKKPPPKAGLIAKENTAWRKTLTDDEKGFLKDYKADDYLPINRKLRKGSKATKFDEAISRIDSAIEKANPSEKDAVLWRGVGKSGKFSDINVGDVFQDDGYMSTSYKEATTKDFGQVLKIFTRRGSKLVDIDAFGITPLTKKEGEILLPRGSKLRMIKKERVGRQTELWAELLQE